MLGQRFHCVSIIDNQCLMIILGTSQMQKTRTRKYETLKLLGRSATRFPAAPASRTLETFPNKFPNRDYWIRFDSPEFTSMCPVTGQPDFARITIQYVADKLCIESKSLKFYLASYRNTRSFNEEVVNRILDDIVAACSPRRVIVRGEFAARGGISLTVDAAYPDSENATPPGGGDGGKQ
jgi:7-cyano-7-deazaguanine reductase